MSLESLMDVRVTSVSRYQQELQGTAAAVYVVTREDIRRSGATDVTDLLRMVPGMHVAQLDGSVWAISARGFAAQSAAKMLVLVDGRSVYDPTFSGVVWHLQNLVLEDIDRIEVIRGPGGTMWGANAVNGVINITTRRGTETPKGLLAFDAGTTSRGEGTIRYGGSIADNATYRVFGRHTSRTSLATDSGEDARDAWRLTTGGFRLDWDITGKDALTLEANAYEGHQGRRQAVVTSLAPLTYEPIGRQGSSGGHVRGRYWRNGAGDSSLGVQFYYDRRVHTGYGARSIDVFDFETQYSFRLGHRNHISIGGGHRVIADDLESSLSIGFTTPQLTSHLSNLFFQDEISIVDDALDLTLGSKFERSSFTGYDVQPTVRLSWRPAFRHTIWGAASHAVRTPNRVERGVVVNLETFDTDPVRVVTAFGREGTRAEELTAYEAGYRYQSNRRFWLDFTTFYNLYDDLSTTEPGEPFFQADPSPPRLVMPIHFGNGMRGKAYGAELALRYEVTSSFTLRGNYSWLELDLESDSGLRELESVAKTEGRSPAHQTYLGSFLSLPLSLELAQHLYFVDQLPTLEIPAYTRADVNLTWKGHDELELSLVGQNLFGSHIEFHDAGTAPSVIDRRIYGLVRWRF